MRLIFIRHADPDYEHNCLTEKGFREAEILSGRVGTWDHIRAIYVSPLPRAQMTAAPCLRALKRTAVTCDWLREFDYPVKDPTTGRAKVAWDFFPSFFENEPALYDREKWAEVPVYTGNPDLLPAYQEVCRRLDALLLENGYDRAGRSLPVYSLAPAKTAGDDGDALLFFCHYGITSVLLSHLTGISPFVLLHHTVELPTGITVVNAEKRRDDLAHFRIQYLGDTAHLRESGEPMSGHAAFSDIFQQ